MPEPVNTHNRNRPVSITRAVPRNHSRGEVQPSPQVSPESKTLASEPNTATTARSATHPASSAGSRAALSQTANNEAKVPASQVSTEASLSAKLQAPVLRSAVIHFSSKIDQITLSGENFNIDFSSYSSRRSALKAASYLINTHQASPNTQTTLNEPAVTSKGGDPFLAQLISLGKPVSISLPDALKSLIQQHGIDLSQLKQLSSRPQGYPLPTANIDAKTLTLSNGLSLLLPQSSLSALNASQASLARGVTARIEVVPSIHYQNQQWVLKLTPIIETSNVELTPSIQTQSLSRNTGEMGSQLLLAKPELSKLYSSLIKTLEKLPYKESTGLNSVSSINISAAKLSPTGALPEVNSITGANIKAEALANTLVNTTPTKPDAAAPDLQASTEQSKKPQTHQTQEPQNKEPQIKGEDAKTTSTKNKPILDINLPLPNQKNSVAFVSTEKQDASTSVSSTNRELMLNALNKAFGKAGGLPQSTEKAAEPQQSLASLLVKILPQIQPSMLRTLALPSNVEKELAGLLNLSSFSEINTLARASVSHMNSVSMLFQLLIGIRPQGLTGKTGSGNSSKLSVLSQKYLQKLQAQLGVNNATLSLFDKAGTTETLAKLVNNLNLYSHASNENNGQTNWYFTFPYSLNQQQEQLEGQFTKEDDSQEDNPNSNWRLQLKFNLVQGPLLIKTHIKDNRLDMTFNGEDDTLLNKIDLLLPPLMKKLVDIGLTPDKVVTQRAKVPATLLPGDHYLVKIKA